MQSLKIFSRKWQQWAICLIFGEIRLQQACDVVTERKFHNKQFIFYSLLNTQIALWRWPFWSRYFFLVTVILPVIFVISSQISWSLDANCWSSTQLRMKTKLRDTSWFHEEVQPLYKFIRVKVHVVICLNNSEFTCSHLIVLNVLWQPCPKYLHPLKSSPPRKIKNFCFASSVVDFNAPLTSADCNYQCWPNYSTQLSLVLFSYLKELSSSRWAHPSKTGFIWINLPANP